LREVLCEDILLLREDIISEYPAIRMVQPSWNILYILLRARKNNQKYNR